MILKLVDILKTKTALTPDAGEPIFIEVSNALKLKNEITLDFQGIELLSSAFLNVAIGQLYSSFQPDELNNNLKIINLASEDIALLRKVISRAKEYFKDRKGFNERMEGSYGDGSDY